jgi:hypothetical protein
MNSRLNDGEHEITLKTFKFNINEKCVYCFLPIYLIKDMQDFFDEISTGKILWEKAKEKFILTIAKKEYPEMDEDRILYFWKKQPNMFGRGQLKSIFNDLESSSEIKEIIRNIKIDQVIE